MTERGAKEYLGDGLYASFDGYHLWLTTEAGPGIVTNKVALEPEVLIALGRYVQRLKAPGETLRRQMVRPGGGVECVNCGSALCSGHC